jgi:hypothetical protein
MSGCRVAYVCVSAAVKNQAATQHANSAISDGIESPSA